MHKKSAPSLETQMDESSRLWQQRNLFVSDNRIRKCLKDISNWFLKFSVETAGKKSSEFKNNQFVENENPGFKRQKLLVIHDLWIVKFLKIFLSPKFVNWTHST